jgi:hypothetical protein
MSFSIDTRRLSMLLKKSRLKCGFSLHTASILMGADSRQHLHKMESGKRPFSKNLIMRACEVYGITIDDCAEAFSKDALESFKQHYKERQKCKS